MLTEKEQLSKTILVIVKLSFICLKRVLPISGVLEETSIISRETPSGEACPGETPQAHRRLGGFPDRPRKASALRSNQRITVLTDLIGMSR